MKKYIPVRHPDAVVWAMREAYRVAMTGRPGPVVVDFYRDVIEKGECDYTSQSVESYCADMAIEPSDAKIDAIISKLAGYKKVSIWCGNGVKISHCGGKVIELAEKLSAPVVTTFNGISSVPTEHPLVFGARSRHGTELSRRVLEETDCVLVLGSSMSSVSTNRWGLNLPDIIQIDFAPEQIGRQYPVCLGVVGELNAALNKLNARIAPCEYPERAAWVKALQNDRAAWLTCVYSGAVNDPAATPAAPVALMAELNRCFREDDIICVDAGNPGAWSHLFKLAPTNRYFKPVNYGNMGFSIPAALASSMAEPDKRVFCFIGDGSLGMTLGDLETLSRFTKNVTIVVFNDHAYGNIKQEELFKFGEGHYYGVDLFRGADYAGVAKALGLGAEKIASAAELPAAVEHAQMHDGSYMIEVDFDGSYTIWPEAFLWNKEK